MEYEFTIRVRINGDVTEYEARDFIGFECGAICVIGNDNPLMDEDNNAEISSIDIF
ncbi:hypothetical protein RPMD05_42 [Rhodobacteraceae phage LS06-2018-MD05]|nr:hypothetical protein RPMD05_42 [Rhodobacteraceae phage LS06-2018-MD05]